MMLIFKPLEEVLKAAKAKRLKDVNKVRRLENEKQEKDVLNTHESFQHISFIWKRYCNILFRRKYFKI
jgi:hypothetical protein